MRTCRGIFALILGAALTACALPGYILTATETPALEPTPLPQAPPTETPEEASRIHVRWFVGLASGSEPGAGAAQQAVVDAYNASQDRIMLVLEVVDNVSAAETLAGALASGDPPDLVGPLRIQSRDQLESAWLNLQPLVDAAGYDLSDFDPAVVAYYRTAEAGQLALPLGITPSFLIYNKTLFDRAGLAYPPHQFGAPYIDAQGVEHPWDMAMLKELAMKLTIDANGANPESPTFDFTNIVQFGFVNQWGDARDMGTFFGAGSLVSQDGLTAQVPAEWAEAWKWTYDGWWNTWFIPNGVYDNTTPLMNGGGPFGSGRLAMAHVHIWYAAPWALDGSFAWDLAAIPAYNGTITADLQVDAFAITRDSPNPAAAFDVLTYLLSPEAAPDLLAVYGGIPARRSLQSDFLAAYGAANFPGNAVDWQVAVDSAAYADIPSHELALPALPAASRRLNLFWETLANTPGLDDAALDAEIATLVVDLQVILDGAAR